MNQNTFTFSIAIAKLSIAKNIFNSTPGNLPSSCNKQTNALNKQTNNEEKGGRGNNWKCMKVLIPLDNAANAAMAP